MFTLTLHSLLTPLCGYLGAGVMGTTLGLIGGGGSILAVPLLVYLFGFSGSQATFSSLFVVGICAGAGAIPFARRRLVATQTAMLFFVPSLLGVLISRRALLPALPATVSIGNAVSISKDLLILCLFGGVMLAASGSMIRKTVPKQTSSSLHPTVALVKTLLTGVAVGITTGFVGAGGGFLIVPALVNGLSLSMERAVGTSLLIIALNSLLGFFSDWLTGATVPWASILPFTFFALVGILLGTALNRKIPVNKLKPAFGWFVLVLGAAMILKQIYELKISNLT